MMSGGELIQRRNIMEELLRLKNTVDDFEVEFDIITPAKLSIVTDERMLKINQCLETVESQLELNRKQIDEINAQIDRLTNHADGIDYMVAVASGILTGLIDSFFVKEFDKLWGDKKVNKFVIENAKKQKVEDKVKQAIENAKKKNINLSQEQIGQIRENIEKEFSIDDNNHDDVLRRAIKYFEDKYKLPGDNIHQNAGLGISPSSHHLDDLAHHPTLLGLLCAIITQFTKKGVYQNADGKTRIIIAEDGFIGTDIPSKIFAGTVNWFWHLVSDMAGSKSTPGAGMGIPGPIMSLAKEIAMIPGINKTPLPKLLNKLFVDKRIDLRFEVTLAHELGKQAIPVIINETIVRSFYFIRRLAMQYKEKGSLKDIEWEKTLPFKNRTIVRMITISSGTFMAVDLADAAIRAAVKSGGFGPGFLPEFVLRVNFVGIGRFAVAVVTDVKMGIDRSRLRNERLMLVSKQMHLMTAKIFYMQARTWIAAEETEKSINEVVEIMETAGKMAYENWRENIQALQRIGELSQDIEKNNPGLIDEICDILQ